MTGEDVDGAMRDAGLAWEILDGGAVDASQLKVSTAALWCNRGACDAYAAAATAKGLTAIDVAEAVREYVGYPQAEPPVAGDPTALRALLSA